MPVWSPRRPGPGPVLNWRFPLQAIVLAGLLMIPIFAWTGFYEPLPLKQLALDHPDKWASAAAGKGHQSEGGGTERHPGFGCGSDRVDVGGTDIDGKHEIVEVAVAATQHVFKANH